MFLTANKFAVEDKLFISPGGLRGLPPVCGARGVNPASEFVTPPVAAHVSAGGVTNGRRRVIVAPSPVTVRRVQTNEAMSKRLRA